MNFFKPAALAAMLLFSFACNNGRHGNQTHRSADLNLVQEQSVLPPVQDAAVEMSKVRTDSIDAAFNTENYDHIVENKFLPAIKEPLSTFSIDVDEAAYSNVRRFLQQGALPPAAAFYCPGSCRHHNPAR